MAENTRLEDISSKIDYLCDLVLETRDVARINPELAGAQARKSAEAICKQIFADKIGEPAGKITLEVLIQRLSQKKALPPKALPPLRAIQSYGNFGAHAQGRLNRLVDVTPCLSALASLTNWYFTEYLSVGMPSGLKDFAAGGAATKDRPDGPRAGAHDPTGNGAKPLPFNEVVHRLEDRVRYAIQLNADQRAKSKILKARIRVDESEELEGSFVFRGTFSGEKPLWFLFNYPHNYTGRFKGTTCDVVRYDIRDLAFTSFWEKVRAGGWVDVRQEFIEQANSELPF